MITRIPATNSLIPMGIKINVQQQSSAIPQIPNARGTRINSQMQAFNIAPVSLNPNHRRAVRIAMVMMNVNIFSLLPPGISA